MFKENKVTPQIYQNKKNELEKWANSEKDDLFRTQKEIERGWLKALDFISKTQRDIDFAQKCIKGT